MMTRPFKSRLATFLLAVLTVTVAMMGGIAPPAMAQLPVGEDPIVSCQIAGQEQRLSISVAGSNAIYRFGRPGQVPELRMTTPLMDLDYRIKSGPSPTVDDIITFQNGDTSYRFTVGFRDKLQPDPSAYRPFGTLTVSRGTTRVATLSCREDSIVREPSGMMAKMIGSGRKKDSDGDTFPNYPLGFPVSAAQSPPCKQDFNVDSCWSNGVLAARAGDLRTALPHYDKSCDAKFNTVGCYDAGKLYLHNRALRDYPKARDRLNRACEGDDPGEAPYACKYLGWMALTGIGAPRDLDEAWGKLTQACFTQNEHLMIDAEGCHFLAQAALEKHGKAPRQRDAAPYIAYISLAMGCADDATTVCEEGRALYRREAARGARWIKQCDAEAVSRGTGASCAAFMDKTESYEANQAKRRHIFEMFTPAMRTMG